MDAKILILVLAILPAVLGQYSWNLSDSSVENDRNLVGLQEKVFGQKKATLTNDYHYSVQHPRNKDVFPQTEMHMRSKPQEDLSELHSLLKLADHDIMRRQDDLTNFQPVVRRKKPRRKYKKSSFMDHRGGGQKRSMSERKQNQRRKKDDLVEGHIFFEMSHPVHPKKPGPRMEGPKMLPKKRKPQETIGKDLHTSPVNTRPILRQPPKDYKKPTWDSSEETDTTPEEGKQYYGKPVTPPSYGNSNSRPGGFPDISLEDFSNVDSGSQEDFRPVNSQPVRPHRQSFRPQRHHQQQQSHFFDEPQSYVPDIGTNVGHREQFHEQGTEGYNSYKFGYNTGDLMNPMERYEERGSDGVVRGRYSFIDPLGKLQVVRYESHPELGFRTMGSPASHSLQAF